MAYSRVLFIMTIADLQWLSEIFSGMKHRAASLRQMSFLSLFLMFSYAIQSQ